jgi:hypothetical protein
MSPLSSSDFRDIFFDEQTAPMFLAMIMDPEMSWEGDRVIVAGDYQRDLPPSLADVWETTFRAQTQHSLDEDGNRFLSHLIDSGFEEVHRSSFQTVQGRNLVLRNLSKLEYVKADDFCCTFLEF